MNKTDDILEKLKNAQQPDIDMTEQIMGNLTSISSPMREGRSISIMPIVRAVLTMAAMWIIGFFIYLQYDVTTPSAVNNSSPFEEGWEGASTLQEVYKSRLCQDCKKTISYTQFKTMLYENK